MIFLIAGCSKLGPNFNGIKSDVKLPSSWEKGRKISNKELTSWWEIFQDKTLNKLIVKAYRQNLDIKSAGIRILQARAVLGITRGLYYPQSQKISGNAMASKKGSQSVNSTGLNFDIGWEMDIWGKYARGVESAEADLYLSVASYRDIMVSILAEVARNYINYRSAEERIAYAKRNILIQKRVAKMTEIQFNSGNVSELDMQQARTQLYSTRAVLPSIELSKIQSRNALAILLGTNIKEIDNLLKNDTDNKDSLNYISGKKSGAIQLSESKRNIFDISFIPTPKNDIDIKLDANLLKRRPDIKVAEFKAHSAMAKIGSTEALLYPSFILIGNIGINSNDAKGSWVNFGDSLSVLAGPTFSWNIFQYDRIKNQVRLQDAIFQEAIINYNKKLLQAVGEVSNALNGYRLTKLQLKENELALKATIRAFNLSSEQYNNGLVNYQRLLSTVEKLTRIQDTYAQVKGLVAINTILLYKSLGGGWQLSNNKSYISKKSVESFKKRGVDWGEMLDENQTKLVEEISYE
jgi:outer membrane protein TolC